MMSQDQRDFLKQIAKGIRDVMEEKGRDVKIATDPMNDIEVFLSEYIERTTCCIIYESNYWFADDIFIRDIDVIEESRLRELLFYFDYTGISFQEVVKYARVNDSQYARATSFEQFLRYSNDHTHTENSGACERPETHTDSGKETGQENRGGTSPRNCQP